MKKMYAVLFIALISIFISKASAGTVWQVATGADLYTTYSNAGFVSGDIIELTTDGGAYTWGTKLGTITKSFTIKAAAGLTARPVVSPLAYATTFSANAGGALTPVISFDGIEFAGNATITTFIIAGKTTEGGTLTLSVNNCKFSGFSNAAINYFYYSNSQSTTPITANFGDLTISNSIFDGGNTVIYEGSAAYCVPNNIKLTNNYFKNIKASVVYNAVLTNVPNSIIINHCTFDGCATGSSKGELYIKTSAPTVVKNSLFANRSSSTNSNFYGAAGTEPSVMNGVYYTGTGTLNSIYPIAALGDYVTAGFNVDPVIGTNLEATASVYYNAGSDGKTIGYVASGITTAVPKSVKANKLTISQTGVNFKINGIADAAFTVYSVGGSQVATGVIVDGNFQMTANKGIYILKSNGQVAKFAVR